VSVQVILEADSRLTKSGVVSLLRKMGAEVIEDDELMDPDDLEIRAWLPLSSMSMDGRVQRDRRIAAENPGDANFDVAYRCAFTMNASDYEARAWQTSTSSRRQSRTSLAPISSFLGSWSERC
jgi:hypothetical protein